MEKFLKLLVLFALSVAFFFYRLFIIIKVWGYIAVKLFGLPPVDLWKAFAVASLMGVFTLSRKDLESKKQTTEKQIAEVITFALVFTFYWGMDYWFFG